MSLETPHGAWSICKISENVIRVELTGAFNKQASIEIQNEISAFVEACKLSKYALLLINLNFEGATEEAYFCGARASSEFLRKGCVALANVYASEVIEQIDYKVSQYTQDVLDRSESFYDEKSALTWLKSRLT